ncbi:hypothetical protein EXN22_04750 [Pseudomonas tructae]|uniref:Uncharacterized protein n=1 Tax=Pseudomonas tructae TaxID=2518644 RepID=A0A411MDV5_9PSED|nr:hypothetical protein EXN22_04750 [Pseudomonas tructae]
MGVKRSRLTSVALATIAPNNSPWGTPASWAAAPTRAAISKQRIVFMVGALARPAPDLRKGPSASCMLCRRWETLGTLVLLQGWALMFSRA